MKYPLYDYQSRVYKQILDLQFSGSESMCIQMPTRSGKSAVISKITEDFMKENRIVWFIAHTNILIFQMSDELKDHGMKHGIISPHAPMLRYRVQIASKDSLVSRIEKMRASGWPLPDEVIVDECHMILAKTYVKLLKALESSRIYGFTATPIRRDGKSLGDIFDDLIVGPSIQDLQAIDKLAPVETFGVQLFDSSGVKKSMGDFNQKQVAEKVDNKFVISEIVQHWEKMAKGLKTLTFAVNIKHAHDLAEEFTEAGYPSIAISSKDGRHGIKEKLDGYYSGKYINLVSVNLFIMGFTIKDCRCIIQARPTDSLMIYMQSVGRGMIPNENGEPLINIDCVNNFERHGLPEDERLWSLSGPKKKEKNISALKRCPKCQRISKITARKCDHCGFLWTEVAEVGSRMPEEKDGQLIKITRKQAGPLVGDIARKAHTLKDAVRIARNQGIAHTVAFDIWCNVLKNKKDAVIRF